MQPHLDHRFAAVGLGDTRSHGLDSRLDAIVEVELGEDAGDVVGDGVGAEVEFVGDLVIAFAAGEPGEDFKFARRAPAGRMITG